ncbi:MAG: aldo/keto reductase [Planctomycetota bacterium]
MQAHEVRWGILGPGGIAKAFTHGVQQAKAGHIVALGARSAERARAFADEMQLDAPTIHTGYETLLADDSVDAIYIATPHPFHARWSIAAADAGKHVFVEKPAGLNRPETMAAIEAARVNGTFFMEAFKDRCHPQCAKLVELIASGVIGEVRMIRASFGFGGGTGPVKPEGRLFDPALGGGGILDVGCYPVQFVRRLAGAATGEIFADPTAVRGAGHVGEAGVDEWASASLKFASGIVADVSTGIRATLDNTATIFGSDGHLFVPDPWLNDRQQPTTGRIEIRRNDGASETLEVPAEFSAFGYEALAAATAIADGNTQCEAMSWDDSLGQAGTLDAWRHEIKLKYPQETPEGFTKPIHGGSLAKAEDAPMQYGKVTGLDKPIAKLIMGCDNQPTFAHAAAMFDHYWELGGNAFDTAFIYGGGQQERLVGAWIQSRNVREETVVIAKGVHTPFDAPQHVGWQLEQSLGRLQTERADVYLMHRDNPDIPVGEFIDAVHEQIQAGRIGVFGGSNWSLERVAAANEYATKNGRQPMTCMSNNFSLARMVRPVWTGCVAASDPQSVKFLTDNQLANFAWSSQARGYFVSHDAEGMKTPWEAEGPFISDDNAKRRERAFELADKYGVTAINIAAAYVLNQPFSSFALIGPRQLQETATSMPALSLKLSEQELAYLDLRAASPN